MRDLEEAIAVWGRTELGAELFVSVSKEPLSRTALSSGELALLSTFSHPFKQQTWLTGRAALKPILRRLALNPDSSQIAFPQRRISLTHSGQHAIAIGSPDKSVLGLGVDLETALDINPKTIRFYLSQTEIQALEQERFRRTNLVELWTVKEAIFKSDMDNEHRLLSDYQIVEWPDKTSPGRATRCTSIKTITKSSGFQNEAALFRFCLTCTPIGLLAMAIRKWGENHAYEQRTLAS
jgi:4'-phosphopantetheinyl transferase EntD